MFGSRHIVKTSLVAALASAFVGCGIASAQQSHSPFANLHGSRLQLANPAATPPTTRTGTFQVTLNITVKSKITTPILCQIEVYESSWNGDTTNPAYSYYSEQATATATGSGSAATCTVTIPYQWATYSNGAYSVGYNVYTASANGTILRSTQSGATTGIQIPPDGKVTATSLKVTL